MRQADEVEFREFVAARSAALLSFAHVLTGNRWDAEDVLQTALVRTALGWHRLRNRDNPEGYVRQAIVRTHLNVIRRRWWRERPSDDLPDPPDPDPGERSVDERDAMWQALAALAPKQRAVVVLRFYEGLSEAEIAEVLGCSRGTVKSQNAKALANLRGLMGSPVPGDALRPSDLTGSTPQGRPVVAPGGSCE